MSAPISLAPEAAARDTDAADYYLISHGRSGGLASFPVHEAMTLCRGDRVVLETARGLEAGKVLGPASVRQARLLGAGQGHIIRRLNGDDIAALTASSAQADRIFDAACRLVHEHAWPIEVLDVELLLDGRHAQVQFVGQEADLEEFATHLEEACGLKILLENLAFAVEEKGGCGKPDCGRQAGGGCTTCGTGGCSSCGSTKTDLRAYFAHLRTKMETSERTSLV